MDDTDEREGKSGGSAASSVVKAGYGRAPVHSRFQPGTSGNPSGRAKGSKNLKTLFRKILSEQVSLREGAVVRKVSKAEAILRGLIVGAMKGDSRSVATLFRLAEQAGEFEEAHTDITRIERVIVRWKADDEIEGELA